MPAPKFITQPDGRVFMVVTPVDALLKSTMVKSVLGRGDQFVVDMNTGKLTILSAPKPKIKELSFELSFPSSTSIGPFKARSLAQVVFHINNFRNRWDEYHHHVRISFGDSYAIVTLSIDNDMPDVMLLLANAVKQLQKG